MFFPLCSGFVEVLVVAAWGVVWTVVGAFLLSLLCVFFLQPCSPLFLFPPFASHDVVVYWEGSGSWR